VANTLSPDVSMFASTDSELVELLRLIFSPNVFPVSVEALNITSLFPVLLSHQAISAYFLKPQIQVLLPPLAASSVFLLHYDEDILELEYMNTLERVSNCNTYSFTL
jgi:hypothetical protein